MRARTALQQIRGSDFTEAHGARRLEAKDDHVGEVLVGRRLVARVLAVDAARGEDFADGLDDDLGWGEGKVSRVVLRGGISMSMG